MKKTTMSIAVASALLAGGSGTFANQHINDRGLGEALIYPFYSAANQNDTYIHIVNTTDLVKAVKVRFVEAENSQEVLDFNLYLSPQDHWAGAVTKNPNGEGAAVVTIDNSCTVPALGQPNGGGQFDGFTEVDDETGEVKRTQPFVDFLYKQNPLDVARDNVDIERTLQGYVEIIEMGQLESIRPDDWPFDADELEDWLDDDTTDKGWAATHNDEGFPHGCEKLVAAWSEAPVGIWNPDGADELLSTWEGGGLYGYGIMINVEDGTSSGYDAVAIDAFVNELEALGNPGLLHAAPGTTEPGLDDGDFDITIFEDGDAASYTMFERIDAVSALLMSSILGNDFVADEGRRARTDWIITQPTKRFYVNPAPARQPYTDAWDGARACEPVTVSYWDREERVEVITEGPGFSPRPPGETAEEFELCTEVSVVGFAEDSAVRATEDIFYGFADQIDDDVEEGWAAIAFDGVGNELASAPGGEDGQVTFFGLPVTGFAVQSVRNDDAVDAVPGVLAAYAAAVEHKSDVFVSASVSP